ESRVELLAVPRSMFPTARFTVTLVLTIQLFGVPPPVPVWPMVPELLITCVVEVLVKMKLLAEPAPLFRLSRLAPGTMTMFPPIMRFSTVFGVLAPLQVTNPTSISTSPPTLRLLIAVVVRNLTEPDELLEPFKLRLWRTVVRLLLKLTAPAAVRLQTKS